MTTSSSLGRRFFATSHCGWTMYTLNAPTATQLAFRKRNFISFAPPPSLLYATSMPQVRSDGAVARQVYATRRAWATGIEGLAPRIVICKVRSGGESDIGGTRREDSIFADLSP